MRVLLVNTSERVGGAAIAAGRLMEALTAAGVKAKMLCRDKQTDSLQVVSVPRSPMNRAVFAAERASIWVRNSFTRDHLWDIDTGAMGVDITRLAEFQEADVIHLHWVNQGFLSLRGVERILASGKPVVWTMHDMWPATSICHHAGPCRHFQSYCHDCPLLRRPGQHDLAYRVFERKADLYKRYPRLAFITPSRWLEDEARSSALMEGHRIQQIPNALPAQTFMDGRREEARRQLGLPLDERLVLFCAMKATDKRKGVDYLIEAAQHVENVAFIVMGQGAEELEAKLPQRVYPMGYVSDPQRAALIYSAADAFVTPSLFENLPNTIAEAMASGTPCVGFRIGGIPEMIAHERTGYIARYRDAEDLAHGIEYVLQHPELGPAAAHEARRAYCEDHVARQHIELYESL